MWWKNSCLVLFTSPSFKYLLLACQLDQAITLEWLCLFSYLFQVKTGDKRVKETAYKTYVRPQAEHCSTVWHPCSQLHSKVAYQTWWHPSIGKPLNIGEIKPLCQTAMTLVIFLKINMLVAVDHHHLIIVPIRNLNY